VFPRGGHFPPRFPPAAVLAYILNPLVSKLEAHGIKRGRASMWVMLFALFLITALPAGHRADAGAAIAKHHPKAAPACRLSAPHRAAMV